MHRHLLQNTALRLALLLAFAVPAAQTQAFEDCFNDAESPAQTGLQNDLEPPLTPMPALTVSADDFARVLAAIAEHERRIGARHDAVDNELGPIMP